MMMAAKFAALILPMLVIGIDASKGDATWAIKLEGGPELARRVASRLGLKSLKQIFGDYYLLEESSPVSGSDVKIRASLTSESEVQWFEKQVPRLRYLRAFPNFNDPEWNKQSYLHQHSGGIHMNVLPAWQQSYHGEGVLVGVVDDGVFKDHPDLTTRFNLGSSNNFVDGTTSGRSGSFWTDPNDPTPPSESDSHGTQCAGIIAAEENNNICGVGVAYGAEIAGIRLFGDPNGFTEADEAGALTNDIHNIHIYSNSWGPNDFSNDIVGPGELVSSAMNYGVTYGRHWKGSIYVFSAGNGGYVGDSCAYDGYINSIYTIGINSVLSNGQVAGFCEACSAVTAVVYGNDFGDTHTFFVAPTKSDDCTLDFSGTSPSAALASGVIALALQVNPQLTWRDVQHLLVRSSSSHGGTLCGGDWTVNSASFSVHDKCGFGLIDAGDLVERAKTWQTVPQHIECEVSSDNILDIPNNGEMLSELHISSAACGIRYLEHVLVNVDIEFPRRGHLKLTLTGPSGTVSTIAPGRGRDMTPGLSWTFLTLHTWGENPEGSWQLRVRNTHPETYSQTGSLRQWTLTLYGTATRPAN